MAKRRVIWLLWCVGMGLLYLFENHTATRILLICSIAMPPIGALAVPVAARRATARLRVPRDAAKHAEFRVLCETKCPVPLVVANVKLRCRNLLTGEEAQIPSPVNGGEPGWSIRTDHCGLLMLEAVVSFQDVFGLFGPRLLNVQPASVWAAPRLDPIEVVLGESGGDWGFESPSSLAPGADASDPFSVREYTPGDPVRQIHWKLSQKMDTVMLRELRQPVANRVLLVFDTYYPVAAGQVFAEVADAMAEVFLSLSRSLLGRGVPHTVCWRPAKRFIPSYHKIASDEDRAEFMAAFFGDAQAGGAPILPDEFSEYFAHAALISTGRPDAEAISGFGQRVTVICGADGLTQDPVIL